MDKNFTNIFRFDDDMSEPELVGFDRRNSAPDMLYWIKHDADLPEDTNTLFFLRPASIYF